MPERANDTVDYVVRFSLWARFQHAMIILLFGLLLLTGMPRSGPPSRPAGGSSTMWAASSPRDGCIAAVVRKPFDLVELIDTVSRVGARAG